MPRTLQALSEPTKQLEKRLQLLFLLQEVELLTAMPRWLAPLLPRLLWHWPMLQLVQLQSPAKWAVQLL